VGGKSGVKIENDQVTFFTPGEIKEYVDDVPKDLGAKAMPPIKMPTFPSSICIECLLNQLNSHSGVVKKGG
jgi:hypothetical protein